MQYKNLKGRSKKLQKSQKPGFSNIFICVKLVLRNWMLRIAVPGTLQYSTVLRSCLPYKYIYRCCSCIRRATEQNSKYSVPNNAHFTPVAVDAGRADGQLPRGTHRTVISHHFMLATICSSLAPSLISRRPANCHCRCIPRAAGTAKFRRCPVGRVSGNGILVICRLYTFHLF